MGGQWGFRDYLRGYTLQASKPKTSYKKRSITPPTPPHTQISLDWSSLFVRIQFYTNKFNNKEKEIKIQNNREIKKWKSALY